MSNVSIEVTSQSPNYEQVINYQINTSFNSLTEAPGSNITIVCFVPDTLSFSYHAPIYPVQTVSEAPAPNGTHITYTLYPITESGVSLYFDLYVTFKQTTAPNTQAVLLVTVTEPNQTPQVFYAPTITLTAKPIYTISQINILPNATGGTSNQLFVMDLVLENVGDLGAPITNFIINESLPAELTLDTTYQITGYDISGDSFSDSSADGITATNVTTNSFSFSIPTYHGSQYRIRFKGTVAAGLPVGNQYLSTVSYTYQIASQLIGPKNHMSTFLIQTPNPSGEITLFSPKYTLRGVKNFNTCSFTNTGNTALTDVTFQMDNSSNGIIPYVDLLSLTTGTMFISTTNEPLSLNYTITVTSILGATFGPIPANTSTSTTIYASDYLFLLMTISLECFILFHHLFQ